MAGMMGYVGAAVALLASPLQAQATRVFQIAAPTINDYFGRVEWVGDIDGDGFDDFVVGSPNEDVDLDGSGSIGSDEVAVGSARLYSGRHVGAPLRTWHGDRSYDNFGAELARAGDLDLDGVEDFCIAGPSSNLTGQRAYVRVISGGSIRNADLPEFLGDLDDSADRDGSKVPDGGQGDFGAAIAAAGDVDRDGHPDLLVAGAGEYHWVVLYSGNSLRPLFSWDVHPVGMRKGSHSTAIASFGRDMNGDHRIDLVFGDFAWSDGTAIECGSVWVYSGLSSTPFRTYRGNKHHEWFGYALHVLPDVSGDPAAKPELLVGAPGTFGNDYGVAENGNYVAMWLGEDLSRQAQTLRGDDVGAAPGSFFGAFLDSGDYFVDPSGRGTARRELFVAARHHDEKRGKVSCFAFDELALAWAPRWNIDGREPGDKLGRVTARGRLTTSITDPSLPDDGDELLVGTAHVNNPAGGERGYVWCLSDADGVDASFTINGSGWAGDDTDPSLVPTIDLDVPPALGTTTQVRVRCDLEPFAFGVLLVGLGDATAPETPHLLVSDYLLRTFVMNGASGRVEVEIPDDPALFTEGKRYYAQILLALPDVAGGIGYTPRIDGVVGGGDW